MTAPVSEMRLPIAKAISTALAHKQARNHDQALTHGLILMDRLLDVGIFTKNDLQVYLESRDD